MKRHLRMVGIAVVVVVAGVVAYVVGNTRSFSQEMDRLKLETQGNLATHVETLARIRTGDIAGATSILERSVDSAVVTLPMGKPFAQQVVSTQHVLMATKIYRDAFPSESGVANDVLKDVPRLPADHPYCSHALGQVAKMKLPAAGS